MGVFFFFFFLLCYARLSSSALFSFFSPLPRVAAVQPAWWWGIAVGRNQTPIAELVVIFSSGPPVLRPDELILPGCQSRSHGLTDARCHEAFLSLAAMMRGSQSWYLQRDWTGERVYASIDPFMLASSLMENRTGELVISPSHCWVGLRGLRRLSRACWPCL